MKKSPVSALLVCATFLAGCETANQGNSGRSYKSPSVDRNAFNLGTLMASALWGDGNYQPSKSSARPSQAPIQQFALPPSVTIVGEYTLATNINNCKYLRMTDGSLWEVCPLDSIDCTYWNPYSTLCAIDGDDLQFPVILVNEDEDEFVQARRIR